MVDVQFEDQTPQSYSTFYSYTKVKKGLIGLLIGWELADDEKQANRILIGTIIGCILISTLTIYLVNRGENAPRVPKEKIRQIMQLHPNS
jgi:hypothetical protein